MITEQQIPQVLDHAVYDRQGSKIGDVKHVFLDDATGRPEWLCVKTGMFGTKEAFVPTGSAEFVTDHVEVGFDKDFIKHAPHVDVDDRGHLSAAEEEQLYRYYGIDWSGQATAAETTGTAGAAGTAGAMGAAGTAPTEESLRRQRLRERERAAAGSDDTAMTRSEERLRVGKETRESGRARLRKYVVTEQQEVTVPVSHEEVRLEREPITEENREAAMSGPEISEAEHEVILHEERPVVSKETVPVERVRAAKETVTEEETVGGEVRREEIQIEEEDTGRSGRKRRGR